MSDRTPLLSFLCIFVLALSASAQESLSSKDPAAKPTKTKTSKPAKAEEVDALAAQQRIVAVSLLTSLADDAHSFRDQALRARVQARAADALWEEDNQKARALFRRAWDDAGAADAESNRNQSEEMRRLRGNGGPMVIRGRPDIRNEVLRLAAKRDTKLGEEFLKTLEEANEREANDAAAELRRDSSSAPLSAAKRIQLARRLLEDGDVERALQFAAPVMDQVNRDSINFLSALREKNAQAADQGFLSLLARAERDPSSDATRFPDFPHTPSLHSCTSHSRLTVGQIRCRSVRLLSDRRYQGMFGQHFSELHGKSYCGLRLLRTRTEHLLVAQASTWSFADCCHCSTNMSLRKQQT